MTTNNVKRNFKITLRLFVLFILLGSFSSQLRAQELSDKDYIEILQLYAKYPLALDSGDGEAYADLYTEDGTFMTLASGREELIEFGNNQLGSSIRHVPVVPLIMATETGARGVVTNMMIDTDTDPVTVARFFQYVDELVKTPDGWRFKSRNTGPADMRNESSTKYDWLTE